MSISYTSVSNAELHRLRESANREAKAREELERLKKKRAQRESEIKAQNAAEFDRLNRVINDLKKDSDSQTKKLRADFLDRLEKERKKTNDRIDSLSEKVERINTSLGARIAEIEAQVKSSRERAQIYATELFDQISAIEKLSYEKFGYQKEVSNLKLIEKSIKSDLENGNFDAAIAISQREILSAMDILASLTLLNDEFNERMSALKLKEAELESLSGELSPDAKNHITYTDLKGREKSVTFDIDFWSRGELKAANEELLDFKSKLSNQVNMEDLTSLEEKASEIEAALMAAERQAKDEFFASCNVESMAANLNEIMQDEGYLLEDSGFYNRDERESFNMTFVDDLGNSVSFVISSDDDETKLAMEAYSDDPDDEALKDSTRKCVQDALRDKDINIKSQEVTGTCNTADKREVFIEEVSRRAEAQKK